MDSPAGAPGAARSGPPTRGRLRRGAPGARLAVALVALVAVACAPLRSRLEREIFDESLELQVARDVELLPPDGLRVTSTEEREIALAWNPVLIGDVSGYAVFRASVPSGPFVLVGRTGSRFETVYVDRGETEERLGDGETYHYRVHAYDAAGRVTRNHAYVSATTDPRPPPPAGLRVYSNLPRRVVLVWEPSEVRSVVGYAVLRSPTASGNWERVGYADGRFNTVYEDPVPGDLRVMYYRILAVNRFGGESDGTESVRAVTKAEPLPPTGLRVADRGLGWIQLAWLSNVEPDLVAYEVWRTLADDDGWTEETLVAQVEPARTAYRDAGVGCGQRVRYRLRAVDADDLASAHSDALEVRSADLGLALAPEARELAWDPDAAAGWPSARVFELRRTLPDRLIAEVQGAARAPLDGLGRGERRLAVELSANGNPPTATAPRCEITVRLP